MFTSILLREMADKLYLRTKRRLDDRKNKGYAHQNKIIRRSIEPTLLKNATIENMVFRLDKVYNQMINSVKQLKLNRNIFYDEEDFDIIN